MPQNGLIPIEVDPEMTLEQRISRLEELEVLRLGLYQASEELEVAKGGMQPPTERTLRHLSKQIQDAQQKIGAIIAALVRTVRNRCDVRDIRASIQAKG